LTANVALPGIGSIMAGRWVGYFQAAAGLIGMGLTLWFGTAFVIWYMSNWTRLQDVEGDPVRTLTELWLHVRWALVGMGLFAVSWLWSMGTSYLILRQAKAAEAEKPPPH
jgi:hypothetical protein